MNIIGLIFWVGVCMISVGLLGLIGIMLWGLIDSALDQISGVGLGKDYRQQTVNCKDAGEDRK